MALLTNSEKGTRGRTTKARIFPWAFVRCELRPGQLDPAHLPLGPGAAISPPESEGRVLLVLRAHYEGRSSPRDVSRLLGPAIPRPGYQPGRAAASLPRPAGCSPVVHWTRLNQAQLLRPSTPPGGYHCHGPCPWAYAANRALARQPGGRPRTAGPQCVASSEQYLQHRAPQGRRCDGNVFDTLTAREGPAPAGVQSMASSPHAEGGAAETGSAPEHPGLLAAVGGCCMAGSDYLRALAA